MSDSLNATVIVIVLLSMISAKALEDDEEDGDEEEPRLPAAAAARPLEPEPVLELLDAELEEAPAPVDTVSPGVALDSDAIVPLTGA
jgi:hypothetical protein